VHPVLDLAARRAEALARLYEGAPARWEFVTTQTYLENDGRWLYLAGHTA
jgi:hypothetical protein